ncbi:MAG: DUF4336 domain-containing protein [Bacteroidota bacterium]
MTELYEFADRIWIVDGPLARDMGLMFPTRMTIVKLSSGEVWISSPVPASFATLERIAELGPVRYLIAGTPRHVWRLAGWHTLFPEAELWSCRRTLMTLSPDGLPLTGILGDTPAEAWAPDLNQLVFKGNPLLSEVLFLHKEGRTLMLDDLIQANPPIDGMPIRNALFRLSGGLAPEGGVGLDMRWTFTDRRLARQSLEQVLAWDFDRLIMAHGACIERGAKAFVERAFDWLRG